jgi:hypothetical protein
MSRENVEDAIPPEEVEDLIRWGYDWFNREKEPPPTWLPDGEFVNAREDPDHATYRGIEAIRRQHQGWFDAYPDLRIEPVKSGSTVIACSSGRTSRGTALTAVPP